MHGIDRSINNNSTKSKQRFLSQLIHRTSLRRQKKDGKGRRHERSRAYVTSLQGPYIGPTLTSTRDEGKRRKCDRIGASLDLQRSVTHMWASRAPDKTLSYIHAGRHQLQTIETIERSEYNSKMRKVRRLQFLLSNERAFGQMHSLYRCSSAETIHDQLQ